jgi:hypothetical protein
MNANKVLAVCVFCAIGVMPMSLTTGLVLHLLASAMLAANTLRPVL